MAFYTINIGTTKFYVVLENTLSTDCATTYTYGVYVTTDGDTIEITVSDNAINSYYVSNGVTTAFTSTATLTYDTSLKVYFTLENSGSPGVYNSVDLTIENTTTANPYSLFETTVTRENDTAQCASSECCGGSGSSGSSNEILAPQLFNPQSAEVISGTATFNLISSGNVIFVTINGQVIDDSEYSQSSSVLTVTPDNGFNATTDEVLVWQYAATLTPVANSNFRTVTASGPVLDTDDTIEVTTSGITLGMITAVGNAGKIIRISNTSGGDIDLDGSGSETIAGVLILTIPNGTSYELTSNGTNWIV